MSRRLHVFLSALQRLRCDPGAGEFVVGDDIHPNNFLANQWNRKILRRAGIGHVRYKDLRDTYASFLLTAGVQLGYVSAQLGHADVAITAKHYARWVGEDVYREPLTLRDGEVPADFIARFSSESPQSPPSRMAGGDWESVTSRLLSRKS